MKKILKKVTYTIVLIVLLFATAYGYLFWANNRQIEMPRVVEIEDSLEQGVSWLDENREEVLDVYTPMLWWMVHRSAELTNDPRLDGLFEEYRKRYIDNRPNDHWRLLFEDNAWVPVKYEDISDLSYYYKFIAYALTCDSELAGHSEIAEQNNPDFCDRYPLRPACVTHHLMGIRIMQRKGCGDQNRLAGTVTQLQGRIESQLTWDPRVIDVYIQRVLMLLESGAADRLKPIWIRRVMDAQSPAGGWNGMHELFPLAGDSVLNISARGFSIGEVDDNFHATAQGVYIMGMLASQEADRIME